MDWINLRDSLGKFFKNNRYIILVLLTGILLMLVPISEEQTENIQTETIDSQMNFQDELEAILSQIYGAGKVVVLLTPKTGEETIYQINENRSADTIRRETVIISNSQREENGLVIQTNPPVYLGALILCQGAENANVRLSIVKAVMSVTGLSSDHITVLKMK